MRQTWKGLTIGALVGAGVGIVLDGLEGGAEKAEAAAGTLGRLAKEAREYAPEARSKLREVSERTATAVRERDLPAKAHELAGRVGESETAGRVREVVGRATEAVSDRLE